MTIPTKEKSLRAITPKGFSEQRDQNMHQSKSAQPDCANTFQTTQGTCLESPTVPNAVATAKRGRDGIWSWVVESCPLCGCRHQHGGGDGDVPGGLGYRVAHCTAGGAGSYRLVGVQQ